MWVHIILLFNRFLIVLLHLLGDNCWFYIHYILTTGTFSIDPLVFILLSLF